MGEYKVDWNGLSGGVFWMVLISVVLYLVGMSTVGWAVDDKKVFHVGLWDACECSVDISSPSWYKATQAMITIGGILLFVGFALGFVYLFIERFRNSKMMIAIISVLGSSVLFSIIGFTVFGTKVNSLAHNHGNVSLSYSFAFTVMGSILCTAACVLSVVHWRRNKS